MFTRKLASGVLCMSLCLIIGTGVVRAQTTPPNAEVEAKVREYFADIPVMIDVAKCETNFRQFKADDSTLHDATGTYVGVYQIDEKLHFMNAWGLNMNLYTLEGNMAYARHLYNSKGSAPWRGCVPKSSSVIASERDVAQARQSSSNGKVTKNLRMGMTSSEVVTLQQILNKTGFTISTFGPGSPGQETTQFGSMTREALRKYQCARKVVCEGSEATTGYGRVGPATRSALAKESGI